jgi:putative flippase GtrA
LPSAPPRNSLLTHRNHKYRFDMAQHDVESWRHEPAPPQAGESSTVRSKSGWVATFLLQHPLARRITGYSAGSVVAVVISEACFAAAYGWGHSGTTWASAAGFIGGAVPNYILNRRWAWRDRRGRSRRAELLLYMAVAIVSFLVSAVVTHWAEVGARHLTMVRGWQVVLITAAYLGVSGVFFAVKFVIYEIVVFTKESDNTAVHELHPRSTTLMPPGLVVTREDALER